MIYSCFDIGGTAIKFGLIDETGRFRKKGSLPTEAQTEGGPGIVHKVCSLIHRQLTDHPLEGIGLSTAGIVDTERGSIDYALSIPGYTGTDWKGILEKEFHLPCIVENDTNCAAWGNGGSAPVGIWRPSLPLRSAPVSAEPSSRTVIFSTVPAGRPEKSPICASPPAVSTMSPRRRTFAGKRHAKKPPTRKRSTAIRSFNSSVKAMHRL